jgi:hypothetical protein
MNKLQAKAVLKDICNVQIQLFMSRIDKISDHFHTFLSPTPVHISASYKAVVGC